MLVNKFLITSSVFRLPTSGLSVCKSKNYLNNKAV